MKNLTGALVFSLSLLFTACCHKSASKNPDSMASDSGATGSSQGTLQGDDAGPASERGALGGASNLEPCVDRWLEGKKLDRYGHEEGTMYAGGTPLFNEATGESRDRLEYIFERHPEARAACAQQGAGSGGKGR
jgi:hypothetical protein